MRVGTTEAVRESAVADPHEGDETQVGASEPADGSGDGLRKVVRARASIDEWKQYYDRADRARARHGDPFRTLIKRAEARTRLGNVAGLAALLALLVLVGLSIWSFLP